MRLVEFLEDGKTIRVRTFSTDTELERTNSANLFELPITPFVAGDFNDDGLVNLADYSVWRDALGTWSPAADANDDGKVDGKDYAIWKVNFGRSIAGVEASESQQVPEPGAWLTMAGAALMATGCWKLLGNWQEKV